MTKMCALFSILMCSNVAFAIDMGYVSTDPTEQAQIAVLEKNLSSINGIQAEIRFTSEFMSPTASYNRLSGAFAAIQNLRRGRQDKILGASVRTVIVDLGPIVYQCQGAVEFKGGLDDANLVYAGLTACAGVYTQQASEMDTQCWQQKKKYPKFACPKLDTYLPSALYFEIRR